MHRDNHAFAGNRMLDSVSALTYTKLTNVAVGTPNPMHSNAALPKIFALTILTWLISSEAGAFEKYLTTFEQIPTPNFGRVNAVLRDERGFLWFGTERGLCKFDGYQVRVFAIGSSADERQQIVTSMIKTDRQSFLLGTGRGLWTFNLTTGQSSPFLPGSEFSDVRINAIVEDSSGTIWVGTNSRGLFSYNRHTKSVQRYTTSNGLSSNGILSLLLDRSGTLWIGTLGGGVNALHKQTSRFLHYRTRANDQTSLNSDDISALCESGDQELWVGTNSGLNILDLKTGRIRRVSLPSHIKHTIVSIMQDPSGRMWIAALDLGLIFYSNGVFTTFVTSGDVGRSLNSIRTLYPDPVASGGNNLLLWVGTRSGVNKIRISTNPFANHIRNQDSLYIDRGAVLSLCEDRNGILWTGMWGGGLDMLRRVNGSYQRVANFKYSPTNPSSLPHNDVVALLEDRGGNLWIGTAGGLAVLNGGRNRMVVYKHMKADPTSLASDDVGGIYQDRSGTIWICTRGGLSEVVPGEQLQFKNYLNDPKEAHPTEGNIVSDIIEDRNSHHWVTTYGRGLNKLEANGTFKRFLHQGDSSRTQENWIFCLVENHEGLFWLSTWAGLVSFDPQSGRFTRHPIEQLHDAHIFGIYVDTKNDLWLATGIGLARFSTKTETFTRFDERHGIAFTELRSNFYKNSNGTLFAGGLDGFTEFHPDSISGVSHPPEIAVTSVSVFDNELPALNLVGNEMTFPHDQNFISFSFAAFDYADPLRNRFTYKMVGVDDDWVEAGTRNYARYPNLAPGKYMFMVRGSNSDNVWNEAGISLGIVIAPPYWQTWWFRFLVACMVAGMIYAAYRYRVRKLLEVERLRLRIADDLHDDVGSNLSAIAMVSRSLQRAPELSQKTYNKISEIYETAVLTSEGMKDLVWFIKPENDTLDNLFLRMKDTAAALLGEIQVDFHAPKVDESQAIKINFKRSVFLAFKEIVTNVAKHSMATRVEIILAVQDRVFEMVVADNGKGFDLASISRGNGLQSLRKRAQNIGGSCELASEPGRGTTVTFKGRM